MAIQWERSLYLKLNPETSAENQRLCKICETEYPEVYESSFGWGSVTTTGNRRDFLSAIKRGDTDPTKFI